MVGISDFIKRQRAISYAKKGNLEKLDKFMMKNYGLFYYHNEYEKNTLKKILEASTSETKATLLNSLYKCDISSEKFFEVLAENPDDEALGIFVEKHLNLKDSDTQKKYFNSDLLSWLIDNDMLDVIEKINENIKLEGMFRYRNSERKLSDITDNIFENIEIYTELLKFKEIRENGNILGDFRDSVKKSDVSPEKRIEAMRYILNNAVPEALMSKYNDSYLFKLSLDGGVIEILDKEIEEKNAKNDNSLDYFECIKKILNLDVWKIQPLKEKEKVLDKVVSNYDFSRYAYACFKRFSFHQLHEGLQMDCDDNFDSQSKFGKIRSAISFGRIYESYIDRNLTTDIGKNFHNSIVDIFSETDFREMLKVNVNEINRGFNYKGTNNDIINTEKLNKIIENSTKEELVNIYDLYLSVYNKTDFTNLKNIEESQFNNAVNAFVNSSSYNNKKLIRNTLVDIYKGDYDLSKLDIPLYLATVNTLGDKALIRDNNDFNKVVKFQELYKKINSKFNLNYQKQESNLIINTIKKYKSISEIPTRYQFAKNSNEDGREDKKPFDLMNDDLTVVVEKIRHTCEGVISKTVFPALAKMDKDCEFAEKLSLINNHLVPHLFYSVYSSQDLIKCVKQADIFHSGLSEHLSAKSVNDDMSVSWAKILDEKLDLGDGYEMVELNTTKDIKQQGEELKQCVGGYTSKCTGNENFHIFRITKNGENFATMSIKPGVKDSFIHTEAPKTKGNDPSPENLREKLDNFVDNIKIDNKASKKAEFNDDKFVVNMNLVVEDKKKRIEQHRSNLYKIETGVSVDKADWQNQWMKNIKLYNQFFPAKMSQNIKADKLLPVDVLKALKNEKGVSILDNLQDITKLNWEKATMVDNVRDKLHKQDPKEVTKTPVQRVSNQVERVLEM